MSSFIPYAALCAALFIATFGVYGIVTSFAITICFTFGLIFVVNTRGRLLMQSESDRYENVLRSFAFRPGWPSFFRSIRRFKLSSVYENKSSITSSAQMDYVIEQMLEYTMRDFVDPWYKQMTDDVTFRDSLLRTTKRTLASLSHCMRAVDWVPLVTRHVADDLASHVRLFRLASERLQANRSKKNDGTKRKEDELESHFFDLELEMEKNLCRDLLSTTPHYENAYLHDLVDILLYLLMPPEDFRCRPLRFLLREVVVKRVLTPTLDHLSDPANVNQLVVWLLSEVDPRPEDFVAAVEMSTDMQELEAMLAFTREQILLQRGKDGPGEQMELVKQQLCSLEHLENVIRKQAAKLATLGPPSNGWEGGGGAGARHEESEAALIQLPLHVVLSNSVAVSHLSEYLVTVGGQNFLDCYLAIEGFKVSVEHQMRSLANGETTESDVSETVREAAKFMYDQYLSQEAITRVPLEESVVNKLLSRMRKEEASDDWFEQIQKKIEDVLRTESRFYPAFKQTPQYLKMLQELGVVTDEEATSAGGGRGSDTDSGHSPLPAATNGPRTTSHSNNQPDSGYNSDLAQPSGGGGSRTVLVAIVETLGIGQQGRQAFALYNVRVARSVGGRKVSSWNILRRYSDFHLLHSTVQDKFPELANLSFPGKKTFNNLDSRFLEKRTKALNSYMECLLQPALLARHAGLERIVLDFLSQKDYHVKAEARPRKMMSAMLEPFKSGVRAIGSAVSAMPEGVSRVGDGLQNLLAKPASSSSSTLQTLRVAAAISHDGTSSIPLRVMMLLVDEVFGVRVRSAWFRRQLLMLLKQFVMPLGTSINRRIVNLVHWLSSEQQVTAYFTALRECVWPGGRLAAPSPARPAWMTARARVLTRAMMLSSMPDELRLVLGTETAVDGIRSLSACLQLPHLNRRLLYVLLERLLCTIFPRNRFESIFAQLHSKSPRSRTM